MRAQKDSKQTWSRVNNKRWLYCPLSNHLSFLYRSGEYNWAFGLEVERKHELVMTLAGGEIYSMSSRRQISTTSNMGNRHIYICMYVTTTDNVARDIPSDAEKSSDNCVSSLIHKTKAETILYLYQNLNPSNSFDKGQPRPATSVMQRLRFCKVKQSNTIKHIVKVQSGAIKTPWSIP